MTAHQEIIIGMNPVLVGDTAFAPRCLRENTENLTRVSSICYCFSLSRSALRYQSLLCTPMINSLSVLVDRIKRVPLAIWIIRHRFISVTTLLAILTRLTSPATHCGCDSSVVACLQSSEPWS